MVALLMTAPAAWAADPVDHSQPPAPDGTPVCAEWVHDEHTVQRGGRSWATWHPPRDPRFGCAFGHEHGSNPRAFRYFGRSGMPAFGLVSDYAGSPEAHAGFKVFVANEDRKGLAWMIVLHQGSGSPRRGTVRFHSLETWLFRERGRRMLARTRQMADFGEAVAELPRGARPAGPGGCCRCRAAARHTRNGRPRSTWAACSERARPSAVHNAITQFDPADPGRVVFNKPAACGAADPAGWDSRCKGDRRTVLHPRWLVRNSGPSRFRTDAYGRRAGAGLLQVVSRRIRVDQRRERHGVENAFVAEQPSDGGIYRAGRGLRPGRGFEFPGYCVLRAN